MEIIAAVAALVLFCILYTIRKQKSGRRSSLDETVAYLEKRGFSTTDSAVDLHERFIILRDAPAKKWTVVQKGADRIKIYDCKDLSGFELREDSKRIAAAGTAFELKEYAGRARVRHSANVCSRLELSIAVDGGYPPVLTFTYIDSGVKKDSFLYENEKRSALEMAAMLEKIKKSAEEEDAAP